MSTQDTGATGGRRLGAVLLTVLGILVMVFTDGCGVVGLYVLAQLGSGVPTGEDVLTVLTLSGVPFLVGLGMMVLGRRMQQRVDRPPSG